MAEYIKNIVQLGELVKKFEDVVAVDHINLNIREGEFITFLGSSGCGKTTTLRMIAGFEEPTSGSIIISGKHVFSKYPHERDVNTVFQSYALFPHMDVYNNIAFGLKMKKTPKHEIKDRVTEVLSLVQLEGYENRKPSQLSGGQKQRIAIARALVNNPKVLLLDEPLGALDLKLRKQMQVELKHLQKKLGLTFIYVTHDQEEALTMSDRIAVMNKGRIEQLGTAEEIYEKPKTKFVAGFIGETNLFEGVVTRNLGQGEYMVETEGKEIIVTSSNLDVGDNVKITIRPEKIKINDTNADGKVCIKARFKEIIYSGSIIKTVMIMDTGKEIVATNQAGYKTDKDDYVEGTQVIVSWNTNQAFVIAE
ncbi:MAG: spermidine/putrescine ABC transporter ATP-binding protein [Firmicutes bacterium HGW-Firmicutes-7]|nr:MAG: spermidine/putrescine ABC transporter ATP-binding protein [Firmicutes bacterium HGW-Firmicutes-7]